MLRKRKKSGLFKKAGNIECVQLSTEPKISQIKVQNTFFENNVHMDMYLC